MSVQSQYDNSHRRSTDQQVKKMILLTQPETLVFQLLHHAVENQHNAVGFLLSDRSQPTAEILLTKKFHTVADDIKRFHDFAIEINQKHKTECNDSPLLYKNSAPRSFNVRTSRIVHTAVNSNAKKKNKNFSFIFYPVPFLLIIHLYIVFLQTAIKSGPADS